jgi:putative transposase
VADDFEFIAAENLKHTRKRGPLIKEFHQWAHRQLVDPVEYKAEAECICVEFVDPKNTSRQCPEWGHANKENQVKQAESECELCGATQNGDYVGAKNVVWRYVHRELQSSRRLCDNQLALKPRTVTPNLGFVPST